jgi:hypothetical protein
MTRELDNPARDSKKDSAPSGADLQHFRLSRSISRSPGDQPASLVPAEQILALAMPISRLGPLERAGEKADEKAEKKKPADGDTISMAALIGTDKKPPEYQTPFMDAYEKSKADKKDGPNKSATLEATIDRLRTCPWFKDLKVKFDSKSGHADYDPATSTITINPDLPIPKQIEQFVHEAFHATHVGVWALYGKDKPLTEAEFLAHARKGEMGAYEAEIRVNQELTGKMDKGSPVTFAYLGESGKANMDLSKLYADKKLKGLEDFLWTAKPSGEGEPPYSTHYTKAYKPYKDNFQGAHDAVAGWDPKVKEVLEKDGY